MDNEGEVTGFLLLANIIVLKIHLTTFTNREDLQVKEILVVLNMHKINACGFVFVFACTCCIVTLRTLKSSEIL